MIETGANDVYAVKTPEGKEILLPAIRDCILDVKVDEKRIKSAGVAGVMRPSKTSVQVIIGTQVQFVADEFKKLCK